MKYSCCVAGSCRNVETPLKWPEAERKFLKKLIVENEEAKLCPSPAVRSLGCTRSPSVFDVQLEEIHTDSYGFSRRRYLRRAYQFKTIKDKESIVKRTSSWFKERQRKRRKPQLDMPAGSSGSGSFVKFWLKALVVCGTVVDVHHGRNSGCKRTTQTKVSAS
ncbi:hypothetical protein SLE2022_361390 [Rubroshorea leprosula]